ncbi:MULTISPECIES: MarR family transcriptional regulator [unclassified Staphylococcus]|uniref:transcriptional regulator, SarA/Rot family n=1 Tax=unclassified Staphylococcus TaxID=91994 RepID=UPI001AEC6CDF|nr:MULTISPECIES: MarR family transcriptional regulator [unclassified Staphylococcus]
MNTIIYEEKRGFINKVVKQNLNLTISEVIILDKLLYLNKNKINAIELKKLLQVQNSPVSSQINHFIELNLLKKSRDQSDERCIYLHDIKLEEIKQLIEQYHLIVNSILHSTA